jgi:FkbM family methyltransferase
VIESHVDDILRIVATSRKVLTKFLQRTLAKVGFHLVADWKVPTYAQSLYLRRLFELIRPVCVIDVGANAGQFHDFIRNDIEFDGWIVSVEPIPHHARALKERAVKEKTWIVEECALGSAPQRATFQIMRNSEFSSFLEPDHTSIDIFRNQNQVINRIEVTVDTLDALVQRHLPSFGDGPIYLKLDTQGFDLEVIKGGKRTIQTTSALQFEASARPIYADVPDYKTAIATIESLGFELSAIYPNNAGHFPTMVEFDCHLVSRFLGPNGRLTQSTQPDLNHDIP